MLLGRILALGTLAVAAVDAIAVESGSLRTDATTNPIAVDSAEPRLSWRLTSTLRGDKQTAYQIQASTLFPGNSSSTAADLWDSGKIDSINAWAAYSGTPLSSRTAVSWRVRVWDLNGSPSPWSDAATFEVSLLSSADWSAKWIGNAAFKTGNNSLPRFAKEFTLSCKSSSDVSRARLYLLGLGLHYPLLNNKEVTDTHMMQAYANLNKTMPYSTYDVAAQLKTGKNVLGVELGKGEYDAEVPLLGRYTKLKIQARPLMLIAQLEYTCSDGTHGVVNSDDSWVTSTDGPYIEASWYGGEEFDARKDLAMRGWAHRCGNRTGWANATIATPPAGTLVSPKAPPLRIIQELPAVAVKQVNGAWVFDFGMNFAGWFSLKINAADQAGKRIVFYPGENVTDAGAVTQASTGSPIFDGYTLSEAPSQTYAPRYMYHGFQYISVNLTWTPSVSDMTAYIIRADNEATVSVSTSNQLFNGIHKIVDRSIQSNMMSVLTDCPHREKYGWLEQDHLVFKPVAMGYDIQAYGTDFVRTIADAQTSDVPGLIPDIAPEYGSPMGGGYRNDPNWGSAMVKFPLQLYKYYGDIRILQAKHQTMVEYVDYLIDRAAGNPYINDGGLGDWEGIGLTDTFGYHNAAQALAEVEAALGNADAAQNYTNLYKSLEAGVHTMWFNTTGSPHYCTNSQACNAMALDMGAVPDEYKDAVVQNLVDSIVAQGYHWTVGEIGLPSLFRALQAAGRDDVIYKLMNATDGNSYGVQVLEGATSLWEHWDAPTTGGSLNHFMFGYGDSWLLQLSGLEQPSDSVAWASIEFKPIVVGDLTAASTAYRTPTGVASASWKLTAPKTLAYEVIVPVGSTGTVTFPSILVTEGGISLANGTTGNGIVSTLLGATTTTVLVGSGTYQFEANLA